MREIKFRAYIKNENLMVYIEMFEINSFFGWNDKKTIIMQYTGLKDKINKNEVYEHDIINHIEYGFLKVEWDYKDTGWICLDKQYKKRKLADVLLSGGIRVGNIYKNPELLNERG